MPVFQAAGPGHQKSEFEFLLPESGSELPKITPNYLRVALSGPTPPAKADPRHGPTHPPW